MHSNLVLLCEYKRVKVASLQYLTSFHVSILVKVPIPIRCHCFDWPAKTFWDLWDDVSSDMCPNFVFVFGLICGRRMSPLRFQNVV